MFYLRNSKNVKLIRLTHQEDDSSEDDLVWTWHAAIPHEGTSLEIGQVNFEVNERDLSPGGLPTQKLNHIHLIPYLPQYRHKPLA